MMADKKLIKHIQDSMQVKDQYNSHEIWMKQKQYMKNFFIIYFII